MSDKMIAFGDANSRIMIGSIAAYWKEDDGIITVRTKSGDSLKLFFNQSFLRDAAFTTLDKYFNPVLPLTVPCEFCVRRGKVEIPADSRVGRVESFWCDYCDEDRSWHRFKHIEETAENAEDD